MSILTASRPVEATPVQALPALGQWDLVRAISVLETDPYFDTAPMFGEPDDAVADAFATGLEELLSHGLI